MALSQLREESLQGRGVVVRTYDQTVRGLVTYSVQAGFLQPGAHIFVPDDDYAVALLVPRRGASLPASRIRSCFSAPLALRILRVEAPFCKYSSRPWGFLLTAGVFPGPRFFFQFYVQLCTVFRRYKSRTAAPFSQIPWFILTPLRIGDSYIQITAVQGGTPKTASPTRQRTGDGVRSFHSNEGMYVACYRIHTFISLLNISIY
jgi:hypothetical protein